MLAPRDLPLLPVFVAVATCGSFTAAARQLGLSKSVVSQHVRTLEERCGVRLIERSTRRLQLSQIGEQVFEAAKQVLASVRSLEGVVEGQRQVPTGTLRVTAPGDLGVSSVLAPVIASLMRQYPALRVDLVFDDAVHDLVAGRLDVALRLGGTAVDSSYIARLLGTEPEVIVASPAAIDAWGKVDRPKELSGAPWLAHSIPGLRSGWTFRNDAGDKASVAVELRGTVNSGVALRALMIEGAGFGVLPLHMVRREIAGGLLVRVCPRWYRRKLSLLALLPTRQTPPRVSVFLAALVEALGPLGVEQAPQAGAGGG